MDSVPDLLNGLDQLQRLWPATSGHFEQQLATIATGLHGGKSLCARYVVEKGRESPLWAVVTGTTRLGKGVLC